jgi:CspA family cold shock protein
MQTGIVKWFNTQKGFGFIQPDTGGQDVVVHMSAVEGAGLRGRAEGRKLNYEIVIDNRSGKSGADQLQIAGGREG